MKSASHACPADRPCSTLALIPEAPLDSRLSLVLLGGFQARHGAGEALPLPNTKAQALLAYLAVRPGRRHPRDKLAALLWPGTGEEHARQSLRQTLVRLRHALGPLSLLVADQRDVAIEGPGLEVDVVRFEALIADGSTEALDAAAGLYKGELLEGIRVKEPPFDEWLLGERERLRELALQGLVGLLDVHADSRPAGVAIRTAMRILNLDPAREAVHRTLMNLFQRQGRRAEALRQYRLCVDALQRELGIEPELETRRLYQELVRSGRVPPATSSPSRATNSSAPLPGRAAPPASLVAEPVAEAVPLIGRERALRHLCDGLEALTRGEGRVVLVLGEAGIGKSRLLEALEGEARRQGMPVHVGRSYLSEQVLAFAPWIEALRAADVTAHPRIVQSLGPAWVDELARLLPDLDASGAARMLRDLNMPFWLDEARTAGNLLPPLPDSDDSVGRKPA